jgi:hypothetical protein
LALVRASGLLRTVVATKTKHDIMQLAAEGMPGEEIANIGSS